MTATTLLLIRHGQIDANVARRWHGSTDSPLNPAGEAQVARLADHVARAHGELRAVYASPLQRTLRTAEGPGQRLGLPVAAVPDLREWCIGALEDTPYEVLAREHRFFERVARQPDYAPRGGESLAGVARRVESALRDIVRRHPREAVAVVSHGMALALGLAGLLHEDPGQWHRFRIDNCSITELRLGPAPVPPPRLVRVNFREHLAGEAPGTAV